MEHVRSEIPLGFDEWFADGEVLVVGSPRRAGIPLILLAGHVDTVPAQDNFPGYMTDDEVIGLGATDMKGGVAVMLEVAAQFPTASAPPYDLALVIFTREEIAVAESPLPAAFAALPELREAALAIVLEPTDNTVQAGCVGNVNATLRFYGKSAHSARPWTGDNAITHAVAGLRDLVEIAPRSVTIEGLEFMEVISVTRIAGGIADNVIPDLVECHINYRFTPDRTPDDALRFLETAVAGDGELEIVSVSPSGKVAPRTAHLARLVAAGNFIVAPKQAWTPVAQFTEIGIDAVNLGPGTTSLAHTRDEAISIAEMERTYDALMRFLTAEASA
jgi:succinyl-diaminopimelate desuccinylase